MRNANKSHASFLARSSSCRGTVKIGGVSDELGKKEGRASAAVEKRSFIRFWHFSFQEQLSLHAYHCINNTHIIFCGQELLECGDSSCPLEDMCVEVVDVGLHK